MNIWAVILAAGQGSRLARAGCATKKQFLEYQGRPLFWRSALTFAQSGVIQGVVFVFPENDFLPAQEQVIDLDNTDGLGMPWLAVVGGALRQDSVFNGLGALPDGVEGVMVHDAARPFFSVEMVERLRTPLLPQEGEAPHQAVIPAVPVKDTIKSTDGDLVRETLPRAELCAVQTPQAFALPLLVEAHERARSEGWEVTDDASMVERLGCPVLIVEGEENNVKITTPEDLALLDQSMPGTGASGTGASGMKTPCVGWGYDVHKYVPEDSPKARPLKLGGISVPGPCVQAHSDGDVLLHALTDALLGCLCQGDIGQRFPDSDPTLDGMNSAIFLNEVMQDIHDKGVELAHADLTVIAQTPKLAPHRDLIRKNVARLLHLPIERVNMKATTEEGLGFTGAKEGIKAVASVTALRDF